MGDKNRPRSKTGRSPSSNNLKDRQRSVSKAESSVTDPEPELVRVENTISWEVLGKEQITELLASPPPTVLTKLCTTLSIPHTHVNLKNSIRVDLYLLAVHFAQQNYLPDVAAGGLVTLFHHVINQIVEGKALLDVVFEASQLLTCKKEFREGQKFDFFSPDHVILITEYLQSTVFQHFSLYKLALLKEQEETIISIDKIVNTCPPLGSFDPPPLAEAISDHDIEVYLNAPPPESEVSEEEEKEVEEGEEKEDQEESADPLISLANVQTVLDTMGDELIDKFTKDIKAKCSEKENQYMNRLSKVKKALD